MLAVIGGSGLTELANLTITRREVVRTPYGEPSGALTFGELCGRPVAFLARHGYGHTIAPHRLTTPQTCGRSGMQAPAVSSPWHR